jgi:hypothetical protein
VVRTSRRSGLATRLRCGLTWRFSHVSRPLSLVVRPWRIAVILKGGSASVWRSPGFSRAADSRSRPRPQGGSGTRPRDADGRASRANPVPAAAQAGSWPPIRAGHPAAGACRPAVRLRTRSSGTDPRSGNKARTPCLSSLSTERLRNSVAGERSRDLTSRMPCLGKYGSVGGPGATSLADPAKFEDRQNLY